MIPKILKYRYSEKATKFGGISTILLPYVVPVKSKMEISSNLVAFLEYMNFTVLLCIPWSNWDLVFEIFTFTFCFFHRSAQEW